VVLFAEAKSTRPRHSWIWLAVTNTSTYHTVVLFTVAKSTRPRYSWVWLAITNIVAFYCGEKS
jgi:hypothetical protein